MYKAILFKEKRERKGEKIIIFYYILKIIQR